MKALCIAAGVAGVFIVSGCSYEGVRMVERQKCSAMSQPNAQRCYQRTQDTAGEYQAKRKQLEESVKDSGGKSDGATNDARYVDWVP